MLQQSGWKEISLRFVFEDLNRILEITTALNLLLTFSMQKYFQLF